MDSFQDDIKYENRIVPEDRDKLISLLEEYSAKLRTSCDLIDAKSRKQLLSSIAYSVLSVTIIIVFSLLPKIISLALGIFLSCVFVTFLIYDATYVIFSRSLLSLMKRNKSPINFHNQEAHALAHRLNKLVGIVSGFYEHVEKKEISRIELDLKISEAESVLNYYDSIVGKPKKYSDQK